MPWSSLSAFAFSGAVHPVIGDSYALVELLCRVCTVVGDPFGLFLTHWFLLAFRTGFILSCLAPYVRCCRDFLFGMAPWVRCLCAYCPTALAVSGLDLYPTRPDMVQNLCCPYIPRLPTCWGSWGAWSCADWEVKRKVCTIYTSL